MPAAHPSGVRRLATLTVVFAVLTFSSSASAAMSTSVTGATSAMGGSTSVSASVPPDSRPPGTFCDLETGAGCPVDYVEWTFSLYRNNTCQGTPEYTSTVNGSPPPYSADSGSFTPDTAGTYHWVVSYSGDYTNPQETTPCGGLSATFSKNTPTLTVTPSGQVELGTAIGASREFSGYYGTPAGTLAFLAYSDSACSGASLYRQESDPSVTVDSAAFTPTAAGNYFWRVFYGGNANNTSTTTACTSGSVVVDTVAPALSLTSPASGALFNFSAPQFGGIAATGQGDDATVKVGIWAGGTVGSGQPDYTTTATVDPSTGQYVGGADYTDVAHSMTVSALPDGVYTVAARQSDASSNSASASQTPTITIDTLAPSVSDDVPSGEQGAAVTVTLTGSDGPGSGVAAIYYTTGADPAIPTPSGLAYDPANRPRLAPGERIRYFAVDHAGNASAPRTSAAVVQAPAPAPAQPAAPAQQPTTDSQPTTPSPPTLDKALPETTDGSPVPSTPSTPSGGSGDARLVALMAQRLAKAAVKPVNRTPRGFTLIYSLRQAGRLEVLLRHPSPLRGAWVVLGRARVATTNAGKTRVRFILSDTEARLLRRNRDRLHVWVRSAFVLPSGRSARVTQRIQLRVVRDSVGRLVLHAGRVPARR